MSTKHGTNSYSYLCININKSLKRLIVDNVIILIKAQATPDRSLNNILRFTFFFFF